MPGSPRRLMFGVPFERGKSVAVWCALASPWRRSGKYRSSSRFLMWTPRRAALSTSVRTSGCSAGAEMKLVDLGLGAMRVPIDVRGTALPSASSDRWSAVRMSRGSAVVPQGRRRRRLSSLRLRRRSLRHQKCVRQPDGIR